MNTRAPVDSSLTFRPADSRAALTSRVKFHAAACGLAVTAITNADPFSDVVPLLKRRIDDGHLAGLDWFTHERAEISGDIRNLQPTARSIISVGLNYWPGSVARPADGVKRGRISRYAWGRDYHRVLKRRLKLLQAAIETDVGHAVETRQLIDTARVVERAVAARSGLGWYGKNSCIISPGFGSWLLLGELVVDLDLVPDEPLTKNCGRCTICIDRCPTGAIVAPYTIDARTCISFLTIEERGPIPVELRAKMGDWVYGCDVCQEECPYTGAATAAEDPELAPASVANSYPSLHWLLAMSDAEFAATYFGTPVPRTKRRGLARNAAIALGNTGTDVDVPVLTRYLAEHDEALVRGHIAWALGRIGGRAATAALDWRRRSEPDAWVREEIDLALELPARTA